MWKLLIFFILISATKASLDDFSMPKYGSALTGAVNDIIFNYYQSRSKSIDMFIASSNQRDVQELESIINEILYQLRDRIVVELTEYSDIKYTNRKRWHNILFCDTYESFLNIFTRMDPEHFEYQGFYLIIITRYRDDLYEIMTKMFETLWEQFIINVNILWMPYENEALMYTYFPYTEFYCGKAIPILLNQFHFGEWLVDTAYFPNKMTNFYGCPLRVATFTNAPFMIIQTHDDGRVEVDGIDGIMLRVLSQKMNFNVQLILVQDLMWGEVFMNGTSAGNDAIDSLVAINKIVFVGAIRMIMEKEVNMTLGYFASTAIRDTFMSPSKAYHTSNLIWIIPPGRLNTSLEKLLRPFQLAVWVAFLLTLIASFALVNVIQRCPKKFQDFVFGRANSSPNLNIVNIALGGSLNKLPSKNFARTLLAIFMIFCFIMQNSYKGGLFQFMQMTLRNAEVSSTDEMIERNFRFYMLQPSRAFLTGMPKVLERTAFISPAMYGKKLDEVMNPEFKGALLTSEDHLAYRNIQASPHRYYRHAPETVLTYNIVIYMHKQSCLVDSVDENVMYLVSGGLVQQWAQKFTDKVFLKYTPTSKAVGLNMRQLLGAFQLLVTGLVLSAMLLILEMFSVSFVKKNEEVFVYLK